MFKDYYVILLKI